MPRHYPICLWCKHFEQQISLLGFYYCNAFPDGIPIEIWGDEYGSRLDHHLPYPNDKGIQFEKAEYTILQKRDFFDRVPSEEASDMIFEFQSKMTRMAHENTIRIVQNPPKLHYIVPLDLPEAQSLRDRCKEWGFDLSLRDNQIQISGDLYQKIYSDLPSYITWLEDKFSNAKTETDGAITFGKIIDALKREDYS